MVKKKKNRRRSRCTGELFWLHGIVVATGWGSEGGLVHAGRSAGRHLASRGGGVLRGHHVHGGGARGQHQRRLRVHAQRTILLLHRLRLLASLHFRLLQFVHLKGEYFIKIWLALQEHSPAKKTQPTKQISINFHSLNQSINQPTNKWTEQNLEQSINQSINGPSQIKYNVSINQSIDQSTKETINQSIDQSMDESVYRATNQSISLSMGEWLENLKVKFWRY